MAARGLPLAQDILLRLFVIGYLVLIISWFLWVGTKEYWMTVFANWHFSNWAFMEMMTLCFFAMAKFVLLFYALIPALAICWTLKKWRKNP